MFVASQELRCQESDNFLLACFEEVIFQHLVCNKYERDMTIYYSLESNNNFGVVTKMGGYDDHFTGILFIVRLHRYSRKS